MNIVEKRISGNCLEAIGIPNKGTAVIDQDEKPRVFDVVWCDSPTGSIHGYLKQIVQTGERSIVQTRYVDRERDYLFLSPSIYGVVLQVLDENRNVAWERPQMTNADRIRSMSDEELARMRSTACVGCPVDGCTLHNYASYDCEKAFERWLQKPWEEE